MSSPKCFSNVSRIAEQFPGSGCWQTFIVAVGDKEKRSRSGCSRAMRQLVLNKVVRYGEATYLDCSGIIVNSKSSSNMFIIRGDINFVVSHQSVFRTISFRYAIYCVSRFMQGQRIVVIHACV